MTQISSYLSEVYVDGRNYPFRAQIQPHLWTAQVIGPDATCFCSLSCTVPVFHLDVDSIEDAVAEWVHRSVTCLLEFASQQQHGICEAVPKLPVWSTLHASNTPVYASTTMYDSRNHVAALEPGSTVLDRGSRLHQLNERSRAVIDQFWNIARAYNDVRSLIPVVKPQSSTG